MPKLFSTLRFFLENRKLLNSYGVIKNFLKKLICTSISDEKTTFF